MKTTTTIAIALIALSTAAAPALGHEHHAHESYSAGEPGDATRPARKSGSGSCCNGNYLPALVIAAGGTNAMGNIRSSTLRTRAQLR